jgi:3-oxoacyl-[acyl-carrier protein] reductase
MKDLEGRVALVTGSTTGLGLAIAIELGARGSAVALNYAHNTDRAEKAYAKFSNSGGKGQIFRADVTKTDSVNQLVADVRQSLGPIDILIPNATLDQPVKPIQDYTWQDYEEMIRFFIKSPFLLTQGVLPEMKSKQWGRIVNIGSEVVECGVPNFSAYVAAKGAQKGWTHSMSQELAPFGITVNLVSPGWIPTDRHLDAPQDELDSYLQTIPVNRWGHPDDVAQAVADFCSPRSSFVTGQTICVNGGRTLS